MMALAVVFATLLSYAVGWAIGAPVLLPILNTLASFPFMVLALTRGNLRLAVARMLLWALTMGVVTTLLSYGRPAQTGTLFLRGEAYRTEMFAWVMTGQGAESTPSQFIPQQAGHAALFSGLALATGGAAAMPMGAVLMNDMGHYVGTLASSSRRPVLTIELGKDPYQHDADQHQHDSESDLEDDQQIGRAGVGAAGQETRSSPEQERRHVAPRC